MAPKTHPLKQHNPQQKSSVFWSERRQTERMWLNGPEITPVGLMRSDSDTRHSNINRDEWDFCASQKILWQREGFLLVWVHLFSGNSPECRSCKGRRLSRRHLSCWEPERIRCTLHSGKVGLFLHQLLILQQDKWWDLTVLSNSCMPPGNFRTRIVRYQYSSWGVPEEPVSLGRFLCKWQRRNCQQRGQKGRRNCDQLQCPRETSETSSSCAILLFFSLPSDALGSFEKFWIECSNFPSCMTHLQV